MTASTPKCINCGGEVSRIRLPSPPQLDQEVELTDEALAALRIWQARPGEIVTLMDPQWREYRARVTAVDEQQATVLPFAEVTPTRGPLSIELYQALPEKERLELVLQKVTELGATRVVPYTCRRSITLQQRDAGQKKSHRWPDVLLRAARQSRRSEIPELFPVVEWYQALSLATEADLALICYEGEGTRTLGQRLEGFEGQRIALIVGPEGGFGREEIAAAIQKNILPTGLGPRILRTETAAIAAVTAIQYGLGDFVRARE